MSSINNPVMISGVKSRMRSFRSFLLLSIFLLLLLGIMGAMSMTNAWGYGNAGYYTAQSRISNGRVLYGTVAAILFSMTVLIVPGMTSGLIAGERERQTLDLLLCTPMSGFAIVWGKLFSSLAYFILLIVATFPLIAVVFLFGGPPFIALLQMLGFIVVCAIACGCIGIFYSSICKRTTIATILTYLTIFAFGIGTIAIGVIHTLHTQNQLTQQNVVNSQEFFSPILMVNPALGLLVMINEQLGAFNYDLMSMFRMYSMGMFSGLSYFPFVSTLFMLLFSAILIVGSSILIKPINKLSLSGRKRGAKKRATANRS